jgi:hypothetical protein
MALADVPGMGAYYQRRQMIEQEPMQQLQQVQGAIGLMEKMRARDQEQQFRTALAESGGDVEKALQIALKGGNVDAAAKLSPLVKLAQEQRQAEDTKRGLAALLTPQAAPSAGSSEVPPPQAPAANPTQDRLAHLDKLALVYASNPTVLKQIEAEKGKIAATAEKAPQRRERVDGENVVQEEFVGGKWLEIGRGPRFARSVPTTVNVAPTVVEIQDPNDPSKNIKIDAKTGKKIGDAPTREVPARALPTTAAQKLFENQQNLRRAEMALDLIEGKDVGEMKGDADATGWKGFLPDMWLQRMDPKGTDARAAIADLGSLVIHERSGAAVTAAEFPRLQPFIPKINDDPETVKRKLKRFAQVYKDIATETANFYKESGYKVPDLQAPTAPPATPAPTPTPATANFVEGKVYVDGKGNKAKFQGGKFVPVK